MIIVISGPQASGKSKFATLLVSKFISTGQRRPRVIDGISIKEINEDFLLDLAARDLAGLTTIITLQEDISLSETIVFPLKNKSFWDKARFITLPLAIDEHTMSAFKNSLSQK